jgi:hypothetical protein
MSEIVELQSTADEEWWYSLNIQSLHCTDAPQNITSDSRSKYARRSYGHLLWQLRELNVIIVFSG